MEGVLKVGRDWSRVWSFQLEGGEGRVGKLGKVVRRE